MIRKILSPNDTGETGTHQAGMLVPKRPEILDFFPKLDASSKNPRTSVFFTDDSGIKWKFNFIYYNNKFFEGTRNEFRITGMTKFIHAKNLKQNDSIIFKKDGIRYLIGFEKQKHFSSNTPLILSDRWITINI